MKVGIVGLGKVGLPLALHLVSDHGHEVTGYDVDMATVRETLSSPPAYEQDLADLVEVAADDLVLVDSMDELVKRSDVALVVVQTPHPPGFGGELPTPYGPQDFDYRWLVGALTYLNGSVPHEPLTVGVVSTVLPGTIGRMVGGFPRLKIGYCPALISLGTVVPDLRRPDFILIGADSPDVMAALREVFGGLAEPIYQTSVVTAELLKVALNAYLSSQIVFANALMALAHTTGADVDVVTDGLLLSRRVASSSRLRAGMGDGGPCRPRDLIALSWLARAGDTSYDLFGELATAREAQTSFIARLVQADATGLPIVVMGQSYKPGVPLTDGSPARLLAHQLSMSEYIDVWDPVTMPGVPGPTGAAVYVVATPHPEIVDYAYPQGSVVIDPWRLIPDRPGVTIIGVGRGK